MRSVRNVESATWVVHIEGQPYVHLCAILIEIDINKLQDGALFYISCLIFLREGLSQQMSMVH